MRIVLLAQAQEELDALSDPLLSDIAHRLETLAEFPELGAAMAGPFAGYRSLVIGFFRVVYRRLSEDIIEIAYIRDCRRKPLS